jgi:anaerobic magnesium-protoporphyrin IX monomethyl ester cyclase
MEGPRTDVCARVALVGPELEENLSLRYLASSLTRAGHCTTIVAFNRERDLPRALRDVLSPRDGGGPPDIIGLSLAFQWRARDFLGMAVALREAGYKGHITTGGHFATFACKDILKDFPEIDSVCRQESEEIMTRLAAAVARAEPLADLPGLAFRDSQGKIVLTPEATLPDLLTLPRPDRRGKPASCLGHKFAPLISSRGCYANCTFCCIAAWNEQSLPGKRYRLREVDDVADEMVELQRERGIDIFVFHDDNFFVPGHKKNAERFAALADALERRAIGPFATVVKARPTDVDPEVFSVLRHRLRCIRAYVGIETDADQGLRTLRRWAKPSQNHAAIEIVRSLGLFTSFNMLIFDPDTTLESLSQNLDFMRFASDHIFNFTRVELYAGTPLLSRMLGEGRCRGDYLLWDYDLSSPEVQRVYELSMRCFSARNFGDLATSTLLMATRFDVEVALHFHPEACDPAWLAESKALTRMLGLDTVGNLARVMDHVTTGAKDDDALVEDLDTSMRVTERTVLERTLALGRTVERTLGRGRSLSSIGDRVATPLQRGRAAEAPSVARGSYQAEVLVP